MLADYMKSKVQQYKIAKTLANKALKELRTVSIQQNGGQIQQSVIDSVQDSETKDKLTEMNRIFDELDKLIPQIKKCSGIGEDGECPDPTPAQQELVKLRQALGQSLNSLKEQKEKIEQRLSTVRKGDEDEEDVR